VPPPRERRRRRPVTTRNAAQRTENIADASVTDPIRSALYVLMLAAYQAGHLGGFACGWRQGHAAGLEQRWWTA
jgi:hypothetical protein